MNCCRGAEGLGRKVQRAVIWAAAAWLALAGGTSGGQPPAGQRPPTDSHLPELAAYLDGVEIAEPAVYRQLVVYPVLVPEDVQLRGPWLTLDEALSRGLLVVLEKGSVPSVVVENRSRSQHVFLMSGEVLSGGKQGRTVRKDTVLAPGQRIELPVFCVEARRWQGGAQFSAGKLLLPQSIQKELRKGADQGRIWSEVARNNAALRAENPTASLEVALGNRAVQQRLAQVRRQMLPKVPPEAVGFIFVHRGRALGAEFFGRDDLARQLFAKLLDSYAVDCVLLERPAAWPKRRPDHNVAIEFFRRICRAGSRRAQTPGSGAGIRTGAAGLVGDGVSLGAQVVHYGVQVSNRIVPLPQPGPRIIPRPQSDLQQQRLR